MNATQYTITAYVIATLLLWGYATHLYLLGRALKRQEMRSGGKP